MERLMGGCVNCRWADPYSEPRPFGSTVAFEHFSICTNEAATDLDRVNAEVGLCPKWEWEGERC